MHALNTEILSFRLAGRQSLLIVGEEKTNTLFRANTGLSVKKYHDLLVDVMFGATPRDLARFAADGSGRAKVPLPGTEHLAAADRFWLAWHNIFAAHLLRTKPTDDLAARFFANLTRAIAARPTARRARALCGDQLFDQNPAYFDAMAAFELAIVPIAFGPPRWAAPAPHRARERFIDMNRACMRRALSEPGADAAVASDAPWEPVFGAPLIRALVRWGLGVGMEVDSIAGLVGVQVLNQNSNSVPASAWAVMDSLTHADGGALLARLRAEAEAALVVVVVDDGERTRCMPRSLRLRCGFIITRDVVADGVAIGGVRVPRGAMVQAPMTIAHMNAVWEAEGHPAAEFWPERHVKTVEAVDETTGKMVKREEFGLGSRSGYWFPYGGGVTMCPGRHFAKQEIIGTLALFVAQFDVEVKGWVTSDGKPSDREARHEPGFVIFQPDRDLEVRVKRRW
ncbi:cytochrome P450 [Lasiosphaeria ovina]|uniref:Cytochrome P450 n=1 Tax=Lasiosphaeria ovina TaxID=92902 RepID=A0AAE0KI59_9PEZI|nr:cytochrome P450 [Lasiosphaeria ovina]